MFEPLSPGSETAGLLLFAVSCGLLLLLCDNVISNKKCLIVSLCDAWRVRISITTQYNSIYVIIEQIGR